MFNFLVFVYKNLYSILLLLSFFLELTNLIPYFIMNYTFANSLNHRLAKHELVNIMKHIDNLKITCKYNSYNLSSNINHTQQAKFILSLSNNEQEFETKYINNYLMYNIILQYFNGYIATDVYLCPSGWPDSVAAIAAIYPRQYGATGRSSVLLTFPVSDKQLSQGCTITFKGEKLAVGTHRFVFTAADIKMARKAPRHTN